ncbi:MAG: DAK2 domain-containing protein [Clostridia bacterium]|nr:DAK2 domain-containing protein [Clostridia bacterium]
MNRLNGIDFSQMILSGANNLYNNKTRVDELNVFPVPDGDTGTNMSLTMLAMSNELQAKTDESLTKTADVMAFSTLRGARGNSGVILSQFFRGISKSLKGKTDCGGEEIANALMAGSDAAYKAVMKPTEGTILTVAREAATGAQLSSRENDDILSVFEGAVERGAKALAHTPEQLPTLKKAGVVDAGGQGWIYVLEGALYFLKNGKIIKKTGGVQESVAIATKPQASAQQEEIKFKYCTEFIIEKYESGTGVDSFRNAISPKGDCMLVIDDDDVVKVHIHTNNPGFVLEEAVKLGEMINLKIDNMKHQHKSILEDTPKAAQVKIKDTKKKEKEQPLKDFGFVSVSSGKGFSAILKDLGVDKTIEGGQTMNPSTDDILKAVKKIKAKTVYVFPNNKNIIMAAQQVIDLVEDKKVIVIPTVNLPQCITAMIEFNSAKSAEDNEKSMLKALGRVETAQITYAVRDTEIDDLEIHKDDILGIKGSDITVVGKDVEKVAQDLVASMVNDDTEIITVYYGKDVKKAKAEELAKYLEEKYEDDEIEVMLKNGGQSVYYYIIGIE